MRSLRFPALLLAALFTVSACSGGTATREAFSELVSPQQASEVIGEAGDDLVVLDVRTPDEFAQSRIAGSINIDYYGAEFRDRLAELDRQATYVVYCRSGNRSATAVDMMEELGFQFVYEIDGGIVDWYEAGLPVE